MKNKGTALMGIGIASGPNRAVEAARKAIRSPLLEIDINGASDAIVFITSDVDITMHEVVEVVTEIQNASSSEIDIVYGTGFNIDLQGELIVTVIATGFDSKMDTDEIINAGFPTYKPISNEGKAKIVPEAAEPVIHTASDSTVTERRKGTPPFPAGLKTALNRNKGLCIKGLFVIKFPSSDITIEIS